MNLTIGTHVVEAPCPECGAILEAVVRLSTVLTVPQDEAPKLRVRCKAEPIAHYCSRPGHVQTTIAEVLALVDDDETRP